MAKTWGYKEDGSDWQEADPFEEQSSQDKGMGQATLNDFQTLLGRLTESKKQQLEYATSQQKALAEQKQQYSQQDEARDVQQARQAYRY